MLISDMQRLGDPKTFDECWTAICEYGLLQGTTTRNAPVQAEGTSSASTGLDANEMELFITVTKEFWQNGQPHTGRTLSAL